MRLSDVGARWVDAVGHRAAYTLAPILGALPLAGLVAAMAVEGSWPTDAFETKLTLAFLTGPLLFGFVAAYGSVHVIQGRSPAGGWWVLGAYLLVPAAAIAGTVLLDLSLPETPWSALAFVGISIFGAVPYAIGSIPFLWPGRTPSVLAFGLFGVGITTQVPTFVVTIQMALDAQVATGWVILSLAHLSVQILLLAAVLLDGLTHRGDRRSRRGTSAGDGARGHPGERWLVRLTRLLVAAAVVWVSVAVVGIVHRLTAPAVPIEPFLAWAIGYLLGMGALALVLAVLTAGAASTRRQSDSGPATTL